MKTSFLLIPLLASSFPVWAQNAEERKNPMPMPGSPLIRVIDRNGDGSLQQEEIDMAVAALRSLDRNKDGTVSADEMGASAAGGPPNRPPGERPTDGPPSDRPGMEPPRAPDFSRIDTDGDGKISKEEAPERMKERFDMIDTSGDGFLDKGELEEVFKRMRERFQRPGQDGFPGMGRGGEEKPGGEVPKRPAPIE